MHCGFKSLLGIYFYWNIHVNFSKKNCTHFSKKIIWIFQNQSFLKVKKSYWKILPKHPNKIHKISYYHWFHLVLILLMNFHIHCFHNIFQIFGKFSCRFLLTNKTDKANMKISELNIMVLWGHIEFWIANQRIAFPEIMTRYFN